jgi:hypothetical protein
MYWRWAGSGQQELILFSATESERESAKRNIAWLRHAGVHGETTGSRLHEAMETGRLPWPVVVSLSSWCHTEGKYQAGVDPARKISLALFNRQVIPRLSAFRGNGVTDADAHLLFAAFAEKAEFLADEPAVQRQGAPAITFKRRPVLDYPSVVAAYSDHDLASPFRSTVPFLAYWLTPVQRLPAFLTALGIESQDLEAAAFEYTVPVQAGKGNDSHTDLMLLLHSQAIAIEAKYTEPPYETVEDWLGSSPSSNRDSVLIGWLRLINRATGSDLEIADVRDCTYQLIHRTASVCETGKQALAVVYQCFDPAQEHLYQYNRQLSLLCGAINKPERISFFLYGVGLRKSSAYQTLQAKWEAGDRDLSSEVKQGLISQSLMSFDAPSVRRA